MPRKKSFLLTILSDSEYSECFGTLESIITGEKVTFHNKQELGELVEQIMKRSGNNHQIEVKLPASFPIPNEFPLISKT